MKQRLKSLERAYAKLLSEDIPSIPFLNILVQKVLGKKYSRSALGRVSLFQSYIFLLSHFDWYIPLSDLLSQETVSSGFTDIEPIDDRFKEYEGFLERVSTGIATDIERRFFLLYQSIYSNFKDLVIEMIDKSEEYLNELSDLKKNFYNYLNQHQDLNNMYNSLTNDGLLEVSYHFSVSEYIYYSFRIQRNRRKKVKQKELLIERLEKKLSDFTKSNINPDAISLGFSSITDLTQVLERMIGLVQNYKFSEYIVQRGDNIFSIAEKLFGNPERWFELVLLNDLVFPYITDGAGGDKVKGVGDTLFYITEGTDMTTFQIYLKEYEIFDVSLYGCDIAISDTREIMFSDNDVGFFYDERLVRQSILLRFTTELGSYRLNPNFGFPVIVGTKEMLPVLTILNSVLSSDFRVSRANIMNIEVIGDMLSLNIKLELKGGREISV